MYIAPDAELFVATMSDTMAQPAIMSATMTQPIEFDSTQDESSDEGEYPPQAQATQDPPQVQATQDPPQAQATAQNPPPSHVTAFTHLQSDVRDVCDDYNPKIVKLDGQKFIRIKKRRVEANIITNPDGTESQTLKRRIITDYIPWKTYLLIGRDAGVQGLNPEHAVGRDRRPTTEI